MGFADVRPFPIPSLVRYKLIDSCSVVVYRPVSWLVCHGYRRAARATAHTGGGRERERRDRERKKGCRGEIEAGLRGLCTATTIPN